MKLKQYDVHKGIDWNTNYNAYQYKYKKYNKHNNTVIYWYTHYKLYKYTHKHVILKWCKFNNVVLSLFMEKLFFLQTDFYEI